MKTAVSGSPSPRSESIRTTSCLLQTADRAKEKQSLIADPVGYSGAASSFRAPGDSEEQDSPFPPISIAPPEPQDRATAIGVRREAALLSHVDQSDPESTDRRLQETLLGSTPTPSSLPPTAETKAHVPPEYQLVQDRLFEEIKKMAVEHEKRERKFERLTAEKVRVEAEKTQKERQLARMEAEKTEMEDELARVTTEKESVKAEKAEKEEELVRVTTEKERVKAEKAEKEEELARMTTEKEGMKAEKAEKERELACVTTEKERVKAEKAEKEEELARFSCIFGSSVTKIK
uniref:Uncharacterized protein n=1 Tax=Chromera velia CCMP2878 TaxID=1169474 RepID=A0A0G4HI00_9ALVE|eukprot:Cvel_6881.t1-p1 / transcript=Cvel_6881.t1 / gene=Cvel_6881 / organism=Chromera_velia_CCMP2878 / gene_product=hypothetical protein / transcript_product=hypothetical protein / location=Cvel_scaffold348:19036-20429(-) / protein_length=290 / sequence_SO=supercontig / SO=protein_coding / is_pseudo=false